MQSRCIGRFLKGCVQSAGKSHPTKRTKRQNTFFDNLGEGEQAPPPRKETIFLRNPRFSSEKNSAARDFIARSLCR